MIPIQDTYNKNQNNNFQGAYNILKNTQLTLLTFKLHFIPVF